MGEDFLCPDCGSTDGEFLDGSEEALCNRCGYFFRLEEIEDGDHSNFEPLESETSGRVFVKHQFRPENSTEKNIIRALEHLEAYSELLALPGSVKRKAGELYKQAFISNVTNGKNISTSVAASIYIAGRQLDYFLGMQDVAKVARDSVRRLARYCRMIREGLGIELRPRSAEDICNMIALKLGIGGRVVRRAEELLKKAEKEINSSGKRKAGYAAATIYIAARKEKKKVAQREISFCCNVTEVTLRKRCRELEKMLPSGKA